MLALYDARGTALTQAGPEGIAQAVWIDLQNPTQEEESSVERTLGIDVPTREELHEIEASSRLYQDNGVFVMTATVLYQADLPEPSNTAVTFILAGKKLVTVRYAEPHAFPLCLQRLKKGEAGATADSGSGVLMTLMEAIIDRSADLIEKVQGEVEKVSHMIFEVRGGSATRQRRFDVILRRVGREGEITSRCRESMHSLGRLLGFLAFALTERKEDKALKPRLRTATRDVASLADHLTFLSNKITFLLDATLGMISIEQNSIIKIFSVAAVVFLPPTLVASIYGMNFDVMPELKWAYGYLFAIVAMILSAILPYLYFKRRGWL